MVSREQYLWEPSPADRIIEAVDKIAGVIMSHYCCRSCNQRYEDCKCHPVNSMTGKVNYKAKVKDDHYDLMSNKDEDYPVKKHPHMYADSAEMNLRNADEIYGSLSTAAQERVAQKVAKEIDIINNPPHYTNPDGFPQVIEILMRWFPKEPLLWQVGKYIARWDRKDTPLENLKKARYYLNVKIKELDPNDKGK